MINTKVETVELWVFEFVIMHGKTISMISYLVLKLHTLAIKRRKFASFLKIDTKCKPPVSYTKFTTKDKVLRGCFPSFDKVLFPWP